MGKGEADVKVQAICALPQKSTASFHGGVGGTQTKAHVYRTEQKGENPEDFTKVRGTTCCFNAVHGVEEIQTVISAQSSH